MIQRFYFAHPVTMYGTESENQIMEAFQKAFRDTEIENPNQPRHSEGYTREGMDYFIKLCHDQDGTFFTCLADGSIGKGVASEVSSFIERGAPAFYFNPATGEFDRIHSLRQLERFKIRTVDETRDQLTRERQLKSQGKDPYRDITHFTRSAIGGRIDITA